MDLKHAGAVRLHVAVEVGRHPFDGTFVDQHRTVVQVKHGLTARGKPRMFTLQEVRMLEVEDHETAFPDLVNVGADEVGEGSVITRAVRVQPFEPIHVQDVHGRRGRQCREGLVLNVNLPVRRGQGRLSVDGVALRRVRNSLPRSPSLPRWR